MQFPATCTVPIRFVSFCIIFYLLLLFHRVFLKIINEFPHFLLLKLAISLNPKQHALLSFPLMVFISYILASAPTGMLSTGYRLSMSPTILFFSLQCRISKLYSCMLIISFCTHRRIFFLVNSLHQSSRSTLKLISTSL